MGWVHGCTRGQSSLHRLAILPIAVLRPGIFLLAFVRGLALDRAGRAGKLCPQRHERRGFRLKPSDGYGNPLKSAVKNLQSS